MEKKDLKEIAKVYLQEEHDYEMLTKATYSLHDTFAKHTKIRADSLSNEHMIKTDNGWVVTPVNAAFCLRDIMRTKKFIQGTHKAIKHQLTIKPKIKILYAGCGPYATLMTPLLPLLENSQLEITLLDLSEISLNAVKKLLIELNLEHYIHAYVLNDATKPEIFEHEKFDIIISETMQNGLKKECQVPITRNLVHKLSKNGTFVPQNIIIDAEIVTKEKILAPKDSIKTQLGAIYNLDYLNVPTKNFKTTVKFPIDQKGKLQLKTTIHLFDDVILTEYESGLTIPTHIDFFTEDSKKPKEVTFEYVEDENPRFDFEYHY